MKKAILGKKIGMTQIFDENGKAIPVTAIEAGPCTVIQIKTVDNDGYQAVKLGFGEVKENKLTKPKKGEFAKTNITPKKHLREFRLDDISSYKIGDEVKADIFAAGEKIDVQGTSKGKGFQGVIKRHGQHRGPMGHGSMYHRRPGSMGTMRPMRVIPGKNLPGHMGDETITIQNLVIVDVNPTENYILVSGNVPGAKQSLVLIKSAVKNSRKSENNELISYVEETVNDAEEVAPVETETTEETKESQEN